MSVESFESAGFATVEQVLTFAECEALQSNVLRAAAESPGLRSLLGADWCRDLAVRLRSDERISRVVPADHVAVQCTYFEKSAAHNWLVPIHQDLSIPVAQQVDSAALRGWSWKEGTLFVQPPVSVLASLVAVRLHLDRCAEEDGALLVIPASHQLGLVDAPDASRIRRRGPLVTCTLERGDALVLKPLLLHASSKATGTSLRRVLHFLFGPRFLPLGLRWQYSV